MLEGGADVGVIVTDGVMVRFGRFVRGGRTLVRWELFVAGVMVVPAASVAPAPSDVLGGGSNELLWLLLLLLLPRCEPDESPAADELMLRLFVALQKNTKKKKLIVQFIDNRISIDSHTLCLQQLHRRPNCYRVPPWCALAMA